MISTLRIVTLLSIGAVSIAAAQGPGPRPSAPRRAPAAQLLLSRVGELELTDAQVVRLAAIARRAEVRRRSMRAALDSARTRLVAQPADSAARRQFRQRMQADVTRAEEQARADQRDAIAVLNADQQARAWELVASRGPDMRRMRARGSRGLSRGPDGMRRRPGVEPRPGRQMDRPFRDRRPMPRRPLESSE
jgi:hypothetical protein